MNSTSTYTLQIRGQVNVNELNPMSPHHMTALESQSMDTLLSIQTDQSGMIGMLVHLHNLGLSILSIQWNDQSTRQPEHAQK